MFSRKKISLAEELLCHFADRLQNSDDLLTINDIETIARPIMADFDRKQSQEVSENEIARFIETLRRSSGLFGEVGENLFCFANQTFQEYFAVLSLLHKTSEIRKRLTVQYAHAEKWREPLLLLRQLDG